MMINLYHEKKKMVVRKASKKKGGWTARAYLGSRFQSAHSKNVIMFEVALGDCQWNSEETRDDLFPVLKVSNEKTQRCFHLAGYNKTQ